MKNPMLDNLSLSHDILVIENGLKQNKSYTLKFNDNSNVNNLNISLYHDNDELLGNHSLNDIKSYYMGLLPEDSHVGSQYDIRHMSNDYVSIDEIMYVGSDHRAFDIKFLISTIILLVIIKWNLVLNFKKMIVL